MRRWLWVNHKQDAEDATKRRNNKWNIVLGVFILKILNLQLSLMMRESVVAVVITTQGSQLIGTKGVSG
jgi:hypothetical protein